MAIRKVKCCYTGIIKYRIDNVLTVFENRYDAEEELRLIKQRVRAYRKARKLRGKPPHDPRIFKH